MRGPLSYDDLDSHSYLGGTETEQRSRAAMFETWAAATHPADEVSRASLLVSAAGQYDHLGDQVRALALYRAAVDDGGLVEPDARCYLHAALLARGEHSEASEIAAALKREHPGDVYLYQCVGESYEMADDLDSAIDWYTCGISRLLDGRDAAEAADLEPLLVARSRARGSMGFTADRLDETASQMLARRRARSP